MKTLQVDLPSGGYPIHIGRDLLGRHDLVEPHITGERVVIVSNPTVSEIYGDSARALFKDHEATEFVIGDGERHKSLETWSRVLDHMIETGCDRQSTVVALGGGVVGDLAGYAAASLFRGVGFIQLPTTLLSQVDSSVGGKTGVNHPSGKNLVGAFYQPRCVIADTGTLSTLPPRELAAGLAEVIKYGLIADPDFYDWIESNIDGLVAGRQDLLTQAIYISCQTKAAIVAQDERESGVRAVLNLGHTFGHAIEVAGGYRTWLHGEAVAIGMMMATYMSSLEGYIGDSAVQRLERLLKRAGLPVVADGVSAAQFRKFMKSDKKVLHGAVRLVLLEDIGKATICADYESGNLDATLARFCA